MSLKSLNDNAKAQGHACFVATIKDGEYGLYDVDKAKPAEVYDNLADAIAARDFYNSSEGWEDTEDSDA